MDLHLPPCGLHTAPAPVHVVAAVADLPLVAALLARAPLAVALDVEWGCVDERGRGAAPAATAQLAFRFSADDGAVVAAVLDLVTLPVDLAAAALVPVLRGRPPECPLLVFGVSGDLSALAAFHPSLATATHAVDVRRLTPHLPSTAGAARSLSAALAAAAGSTLDKREQTSPWARRPLSPSQLLYGPRDATALLELVEAVSGEVVAASSSGGGGGAPSPAALYRALASHWGHHATSSGDGRRRRGGRRGGGAGPRPSLPPPPPPRPWGDAADAARFIVDESLAGLARQLRLAGVRASGPPARAPRGKGTDAAAARAAVLAAIAAEAQACPEAVVLTTGSAGGAWWLPEGRAYAVKASGRAAQLAEVVAAFGLKPSPSSFLTLCAACGSGLRPRAYTRADLAAAVPADRLPPPGVAAGAGGAAAFWVCAGDACAKVYWEGGQYRRAMAGLVERFGAAAAAG